MKHSKAKNKKRFTKIDWMLFVLIIGILSTLAVPTYNFHLKKMKTLECDPMLKNLRATILIYRAQHYTYPRSMQFRPIAEVDQIHFDPQILEGKYFTSQSYSYRSVDGTSFVIRAAGVGEATGVNRQIDEKGNLSSF